VKLELVDRLSMSNERAMVCMVGRPASTGITDRPEFCELVNIFHHALAMACNLRVWVVKSATQVTQTEP
jgi:putative hemolysin